MCCSSLCIMYDISSELVKSFIDILEQCHENI